MKSLNNHRNGAMSHCRSARRQIRSAILIGCGLALVAEGAAAAVLEEVPARRMRDAIELHYISRDIYEPVRCRIADDAENDRTWVFCTAAEGSGDIGGLYLIEDLDGAPPTAWAVNGKAQQHMDLMDSVQEIGGKTISVADWNGQPFDIPKVLELFR